MKKRRTMIVNGEHWQVMNRHIATGPSLHWVPPFRPPSKIPETIQSPEAAEKWMKEACEKVEAANAADRKRFFEKPIPSRVDVTINFPLARWHGAITFFEGNRRDISTKDLDAAEIDNLARLHLKDGLVIQGSLDDLTSDELTRHEKILSMERPALPADALKKLFHGLEVLDRTIPKAKTVAKQDKGASNAGKKRAAEYAKLKGPVTKSLKARCKRNPFMSITQAREETGKEFVVFGKPICGKTVGKLTDGWRPPLKGK